jgi:hypothetical protein
MLDDLGPFIIELPESEFSWEKVKEIMHKEEKGIAGVST